MKALRGGAARRGVIQGMLGRHEKVQENCIDLVGRIADRGAEYALVAPLVCATWASANAPWMGLTGDGPNREWV